MLLSLPIAIGLVAGAVAAPATEAFSAASSDLALVEAARAGDRTATGELVRRHQPRLRRMVRVMFTNDADAEDVVQDAFVSALAAIHRFKPKGTVAGWLSIIALNTAKKRLRGVRRAKPLPPNEMQRVLDDQANEVGAEHADTETLRTALITALGELPERDRSVLQLRYGAELSSADVAHALSLTEANVRKIAERARARTEVRLNKLMKQAEEGGQ